MLLRIYRSVSEYRLLARICSSKSHQTQEHSLQNPADLLRLLSEGQNVALSHELFKLLNDTAIEPALRNLITLFLDEEIEVVEMSGITQDDLKILKEQNLMETDPTSKKVKWLDSQYHGDFERTKREFSESTL